MSNVKTVEVGGEKYNVVQASAVEQKKLLLIVGARLALNSAGSESMISIPMVKGLLMTFPEPDFDVIAGIVLHQTIKSGGDSKVSIDDFHSNINDYFTLVAEAIKVNLEDFFIWLDTENAETRKKQGK